jgi:hypothetical protein
VVQPAALRQSAPRIVRHSATSATSAKAARNSERHHAGVPARPASLAVSAGTL